MARITNQGPGSAGDLPPPSFAAANARLRPTGAGTLAVEDQQSMIEKSRARSMSFGLRESDAPDFTCIPDKELSRLLEQNRTLCDYALPVMDALFEQIENTHSMVILTDAEGHVLHALGDDDFLERVEKIAIRPGAIWSERSKGTNAIGTTIAEKLPTLVHGSEHYLNANHFLTCSAAPIFDDQGNVAGVLDVTGDYRSYHRHTMGLVRMSAQMIENQLFSSAFRNAITLHFHSRRELVGTLIEGIASFTPGGRFLSANRSGLSQLGLPLAALRSHTLSSLFNLPVSALFDHYRAAAPGYLDLCLPSGARLFARGELRLDSKMFHHSTNLTPEAGPPLPLAKPDNEPAAAKPSPRPLKIPLDELNTGDARLASAIGKVRRVTGRDIPILLTGETGTGKDLFAQAIHHASPHRNGPFVAVNCASLPESLIESELFGYEDGAFTGARKNGSIGKILQSDGGTLFLDEIGDMPLNLQARLLRVLQDRVVTPLGSIRSIPVNMTLICASNRNLRDMITQGLFREDLYYRLNGLVIKLPALRERSDFDALVKKVIAIEGKGVDYTVSPEVMLLFRRYTWPGNLRQLTNLLRTAIAMAGDDRELGVVHLSDDFLDEVAAASPPETMSTSPAVTPSENLDNLQLSTIRRTLEAKRGNVSATARALGISRNTIYRKLNTPGE
ncbi:sigma-54-dependent Fis family transcriptional regulator [Noviherbaspirillum sp.]|uniref:sigma-54-dependent Fis family transcriptional regulator n=1 Tax=Noviherbaspirillum sp. TaxID=1926288 RepID=UPI0025DCD1D2|nr:sigma-54-dependent Fis family transcriptional regulator [Noviherbaspirillum sp.]